LKKQLKILFLASEVVPFAKTGGLADVAGALPAALKRLGTDVRLVLPLYRVVREGRFGLNPIFRDLKVPLAEDEIVAGVQETRTGDGVPAYFIEREDMFDRPNLYGNSLGDYYDNLERFSFFSHAALRAIEKLSFKPDLIHCHDWQTGPVPALLKGPYGGVPGLGKIPCVFTIHNLGYQGLFPAEKLSVTGLPREGFFSSEGLEFWGKISLLKAGIVYSEAITTVSPAYATEIQTPEYGMGMEGVLGYRSKVLYGILNGVDYRLWDPSSDSHIPANYSRQDMSGKRLCKERLMRETGLDPGLREKPLLGMISRLDLQKGLDLLLNILDDLLAMNVGLVVLGSGDERIQDAIQQAAARSPGQVRIEIGFNESLAHRIMAGVDLLLIPSRYEPCGLTQMYALKYGTVPVVRATGGLKDTIVQFDLKARTGNGFKFLPYEPEAFLEAIAKAVRLFQYQEAWKTLMLNGMEADYSWDRSARSYLELYRTVISESSLRGNRI